MAFHYEQDEVLNWPQSGLDGINELNQFDEKHMYVFEEEIYLTHANPEEHMSNDWSIYKNTGLEDIVYPDYTGLMGEDCRGAINYNQLLAKYEAATSSGANPFYDFAGAVQDLCESVNQVDEAVLADHITQPNSPQPSFSSIIDYSIYAPDGELEDEQEVKNTRLEHFSADKHTFFRSKWYPSEQEWNKLKEIQRATCSAFIAEDDKNTIFDNVQDDVFYSDGESIIFEGGQEGKGASSWPFSGNDNSWTASKVRIESLWYTLE